MTTTTEKSHSFDLDKINFLLLQKYNDILEYFELNLHDCGNRLQGCCPIHEGDNPSAFNMYLESGAWQCYTHGCQKKYGGTILGFIRALLSNKHNREVGWNDTIKFSQRFIDTESIHLTKAGKMLRDDVQCFSAFTSTKPAKSLTINRKRIREALERPATYFLNRGFSETVLDKYDVGFCNKKNRPMYQRIVVPVYDANDNYVGCIGRSMFERCEKCQLFHNPENVCPEKSNKRLYTKWRNNDGFDASHFLYNLNFAKEHILKDGVAIIVEGTPNCWKLEQNNIHNSVAMFGSSLSYAQKTLLDGSGAMTLVIMTDNDDAGRLAAKNITNMCKNQYRLYFPKWETNDVADLTNDKITKDIKPIIEELRNIY